MMNITRDHNRPKGLSEARREMNRLVSGMDNRLTRRVGAFPGGEFALVTKCLKADKRTGVASEHVRVIGMGALKDSVESNLDLLLNHVPEEDTEEEEDVTANEKRAQEYLEMPEAAIPRAQKLREMLRLLWILEGTHSKTKQIYKAVAKGESCFSWWSTEFPDIPFTNKAVEASEASKKIYAVVAPKLYECMVGHAPRSDGEAPEQPIELCERSQFCTRKKGHVGRCNMRRIEQVEPPPQETEEEEEPAFDIQKFYARMIELTHPREPFRSFSPGMISTVRVLIEEQGKNRLDAYRAAGVSMTSTYRDWLRSNVGIEAWLTLQHEFPGYFKELSRVENQLPASENIFQKPKASKPHTMVRKAKKKVSKKIRRSNKRAVNARLKKYESKARAGFL